MIDPVLKQIFLTAFSFGACGAVVGGVMRFINRRQPGPRWDQALAVGFLIGAAFGAFFGIFQSLTVPR